MTLRSEASGPQPTVAEFQGEYRWLSNFWYVNVQYEGVTYPSVEHAYQAAKTDPAWRAPFRGGSPGQAKRHGRQIPIRSGWDDSEKVSVMRGLIAQKFAPGTELAQKLVSTGQSLLIEGNRWGDTFWGQCRGQGQNWLGRLIMEQRSALVDAERQAQAKKQDAESAPAKPPRPAFRF